MTTITKAERAAADEVRGLRNPDGSDLYLMGWKVKSARQAEIDTVRALFYIVAKQQNPNTTTHPDYIARATRDTEQVIIALAHRNQTTVEEERDRLMVKVNKKLREAAKAHESRTLR